MNRLSWRSAPHGELALLLEKARLDDSRAVGPSTVYQFNLDGQDVLAISLPDGQAVVVEINARPPLLRRRVDPLA
jgi:hypothetical protein